MLLILVFTRARRWPNGGVGGERRLILFLGACCHGCSDVFIWLAACKSAGINHGLFDRHSQTYPTELSQTRSTFGMMRAPNYLAAAGPLHD